MGERGERRERKSVEEGKQRKDEGGEKRGRVERRTVNKEWMVEGEEKRRERGGCK